MTNPVETPNLSPVSPDTDPRKLAFITPGKEFPHEKAGLLEKITPHATVVHTGIASARQEILTTIADQYAKLGTLSEIVIDTHGSPDQLYPGKYDNIHFGMRDMLSAIRDIEKNGIKVANRIVFTGCNTLTALSPTDVEDFRRLARDMRSQIVGYRSTSLGDAFQHGRAVAFNSDGTVHKDYLDTPLKTTVETILGKTFALFGADPHNHDDSWFHCHEGSTQAEGAACQAVDSQRTIVTEETFAHTVSLGDRFDVNTLPIPENLLLSSLRPDQWQTAILSLAKRSDTKLDRNATLKELFSLQNISAGTSFAMNAVPVHEAFIASLSPENQSALDKIVTGYKNPPVPTARSDGSSRPPILRVSESTSIDRDQPAAGIVAQHIPCKPVSHAAAPP